ncbi:hypothetical protein MHYP_G00063460 [Metynnis hypsauchen]
MDVSDRADRVTKLLDTILSKGDPLCLKFLDLLKEEDVNESSPELREWIGTVNTSEQSLATGRSETDSIAGAQMNPGTQIQGDNVMINANNGASCFAPIIRNELNFIEFGSVLQLRNDDASHTNSTADNQESVRKIQSASNDTENIVRTIRDLSLWDQMPVK